MGTRSPTRTNQGHVPHTRWTLRTYPLDGAARAPSRTKGSAPVETTAAQEPSTRHPAPQHPSGEAILTLVSGFLAGVGGVFAGTHSVLVTVIAAVASIVLAAMMLIAQR